MKKIMLIGFLLILTVSITGCKEEEIETTETTEIQEVTTEEELTISEIEETTEESQEEKEEDDGYETAERFLLCLKDQDFDKIFDTIALFDNSVVSKEDLTEILKNSKWKEIIGSNKELSLMASDTNYEDRRLYVFKIGDEQYEVQVAKDYDGKWRVSLSGYLVNNFQFVVPWEVKVYWDGEELDRDKYSKPINTGNTRLDLYTVTCTPTKTNFKFVSDSYGEFIRDITPRELEDPYELDRNFSEEQRNEVLIGVEEMCTTMFSDYQNGMSKEEWCYKHFGYITTDKEEESIYYQIEEYVKNNNNAKIEMIDITQWDDNFCGISMNRVATVNFSYKIKMTLPDGTEKISDTMYSNIRVEKAKHGYIVFELTDKTLFTNTGNPVEN